MPEEALKAYFLRQIDISACGSGCSMLLGDLDGDGRMEIAMVQPDGGFDERYFPHSVVSVTVFNIEGEMLWQIGTPSPEAEGTSSDIPAQIYDIDNDGNNELLCVIDDEFCIFDGRDGSLKRKHAIPDRHAHDCIVIADLEGRGYPQNIILKNRYHQLWALDVNFNVMWTFKGNIGHYPWPYDLDGDGRDELIAGYTVLNGDGEVLWTAPMEKHADCIWVGRLDKDPASGPAVIFGGQDIAAYSSDGAERWRYKAGEIRSIATGNFVPEAEGIEVGAADGAGGLIVLDCRGELLLKEKLNASEEGTVAAVHKLDAPEGDRLIAYCRNGLPVTVYDRAARPIMTFPLDGEAVWADLVGSGTEEALIYNNDRIEIYAAEETDLSRAAVPYGRPQPKSFYNNTKYCSGEADPEKYALEYITGDAARKNLYAWADKCARGEAEGADAVISRADFVVLLVSALGLKAYEREGFSDVYPRDYFAGAVNIAKKLGIAEGTLGRFNPRAPMTAEAAVEMINRAGRECFCMTEGELTKRAAAKIVLELING